MQLCVSGQHTSHLPRRCRCRRRNQSPPALTASACSEINDPLWSGAHATLFTAHSAEANAAFLFIRTEACSDVSRRPPSEKDPPDSPSPDTTGYEKLLCLEEKCRPFFVFHSFCLNDPVVSGLGESGGSFSDGGLLDKSEHASVLMKRKAALASAE
uniref:Uncharacterized protein n=1 Tax=Knipowitschia caucasica TaxID=637954 RepID=A0AAV2KUU3_KNICA